ncbi:unnamed protein product [Boreogadus saida]
MDTLVSARNGVRCRTSTSLGPDQPEGWSWTACTAVTHQTATENSPFASPISVIGGHLAGGSGAVIKGGRGQTGGRHDTGARKKNPDGTDAAAAARDTAAAARDAAAAVRDAAAARDATAAARDAAAGDKAAARDRRDAVAAAAGDAAGDEAAGDEAAGDEAAGDDAAGDDAAGDDAAGDDAAGDDAADALSQRGSCLGGGPVYPGLGQRVEECGIPPRKPRPGPARGLVLDGVYHRHPPDGDREQPFRLPNQCLGDTWPVAVEP